MSGNGDTDVNVTESCPHGACILAEAARHITSGAMEKERGAP